MIVVVVDPFEEHPGGGRGAAELKINIKLLYFRSTQVFDDRIKWLIFVESTLSQRSLVKKLVENLRYRAHHRKKEEKAISHPFILTLIS